MNKIESNTHRIVMNRVRTIHRVRPLLSSTAGASVLFALSLYAIGREVWVARVLENMPNVVDVLAVARFFLAAFITTHATVQLSILLTVGAFVWLVRELGKGVYGIMPRLV